MIHFVRTEAHNLPIPKRGTPLSAGFDLPSAIDCSIYPGQRVLVPTGWAWEASNCEKDDAFYGRIAPRSGLAVKNGIDVLAGVIDADYQGEIKAVILNTCIDGPPLEIKKGDRIAQLIIEKCLLAEAAEIAAHGENTERGEGGFGSTGNA